jgi:hypothetical protein
LNPSPPGRPTGPADLTLVPSTDPMSSETTPPNPRRLARRLLLVLPAAAGLLLLVAVWPNLERRAQQQERERAQAEQERRLAEAASFGQVQGVVTLDGQPLGTVEVAFLPDPGLGTRGATANCYTDDQGRYALRTEKEDHDGALVGHHRVVINDIAALPSPGGLPSTAAREPTGKPKKNRVSPDYSNPFRTPFRVEVRPGPQTVNLELVTPPPEPNP